MSIQRLIEEIKQIKDPRRKWGNLRHKLEDIIIIGLSTIICGGEDFDDMEEFGKERQEWLCSFLELANGIPDGDTFRRVFERLESHELSKRLSNWLEAEKERGGRTINIDGKTIRGSGNSEHSAFHVVSAWVAEHSITLGELAVDKKSSEVTAIPKLLDLMDVSGDTVTIDAMGCQKSIARKIIEKDANYILALKRNQTSLHEDVTLYFETIAGKQSLITLEKDHGRIEKREYWLETAIDWLPQNPEWMGLKGIGAVCSSVTAKGSLRQETRYFITSLSDVRSFADGIRKHWSIENQLHWMLDVVFHEDAARARKDNSPLNMNVLRKTALSLLKNINLGSKLSVRKKMLKAALNPNVLDRVIFQK